MASQSEQMEWEPTTPIRTLLPGQVLTLQRELLVARAGRRRTMGLEYPTTSADHRPALSKRPLERSSPKRQWARILAGVDVRFGDAPPAAPENVPVAQPCLPLNKDSPPITPRKRVIEEVDEPEQYEDHFSEQNGREALSSVPNVIDSPQDVSMVDVFTPPHQSDEAAPPQPSPPQVEEAASLLEAIGLRSPEGARVKRPNWFELQNRNRDGMADSSLEASLQFGSSSHGAVDANSLLSQIPGSWPASPPRPMAAPVDLPVQPSPEVKDAPPSPNSRAREFMMVGGIESAGPEGSTVVPRPADVPMTFLQPESRLLKTVECLRSVYSLPKCVTDCYGWTVQTSKNIISSAKRIAIDSWTSQTSQPTPLPAAARQSPRRRTEPRRDRKLPGSSTEQRRARHLQEKRMKRKKTASRAVRELQSSITGELYVPEAKPVSVPSAAPAPARLDQRGVSRRRRSKTAKSSIEKIMPHKPGSAIAPGRVTKQRIVRPAKDTFRGSIIEYRGYRPDASFEERRRRVEKLNLDFVLKSRPAQVLLPEPQQQPESPVAPVTSELSETSEPPLPASASVPSITPGPCITTQPSIPEGVTPTDSSRKDESYDGYTPRPAGPRTRRRVHWHEASSAPLGQPVVDIRVYDPSAPIRPAAGVEDSQQPAHTTIDGKSPEGPFIKPISSKWDSRLTADMSLPDYRQVGTTISGDPLTRKDFATCYTPFACLNDEVINAYLAIILDYARRASGSSGRHREPKYHAFNSFFYSSLRDRGYESVRRWASRAKIGGPALLGVEVVLIPIHNQAHWTLMVVKPKARTIEYFDSLGGASRAHISRVKEWLQGELCDLFVEEEWRVLPTDSPQQDNGSDCGVFLLTTAKLVVLGLPLSYGARDIPTIRKRIVAEILNGGFEGDFDPKVEFPVRPRL
ncbi:hypothetical protein H109_04585 [Trichophyton interdigitale MR816]|uniref:Ubiquitin-like protease family profile domain-containing protein n=1 Tax=Trichophyton interdigitale (strain MR816) TaxID=1215338 RepID=A0A059J6P3_TRIIM|nr:hypothetical protein H109_04585 [Trichophyton interdigitale MR816]